VELHDEEAKQLLVCFSHTTIVIIILYYPLNEVLARKTHKDTDNFVTCRAMVHNQILTE
jgi:hypothetical protein